MRVESGSHVVTRVDGNRPEAIPSGQCSEGEGGHEARPYANVCAVEQALSETTEGAGGYKTRPYQMGATT